MSAPAEPLTFADLPALPARLVRLVLMPSLPHFCSARERLDDALGPELARFLVTALAESNGRLR
ncbi:MAG TPA: hypothetical protein VG265_11520 [Gaiellaceae bacterium]|jgi:hypothetical protein|nr:hypothetical protein [Gaiellaceae bacterium]